MSSEIAQKIDFIVGQYEAKRSSTDNLIILGPTASGKTRLAVQVAKRLDGEIISVDSRQVYRAMNIGTGKDLEEYEYVPYHLIDIVEPGERYNVDRFRTDFFDAYDHVRAKGKLPIICGGTGSYLNAVLLDNKYSQVPKDKMLQADLADNTKDDLFKLIAKLPIPHDLKIDFANHKRLVRAVEILRYLEKNHFEFISQRKLSGYLAFCLAPDVFQRRSLIDARLLSRLDAGLLEEVKLLISDYGLTKEDLNYYGLEYKYAAYYLFGELDYNQFVKKLNTEIHRYAKRQMTYFRMMEKDGVLIHWLSSATTIN